jgi:ribosomal protein L3
VRTNEKDGYDAVQLGYGDTTDKRTTKPLRGHFAHGQFSRDDGGRNDSVGWRFLRAGHALT